MRPLFKHALTGFVFAAGLLVILFLLSLIAMPKDNTFAAGIQDVKANGILGEAENTIDVLILGDSESYSSIIPLQLWQEHGITAYICGTHGQRLCYTQEFLEQAFKTQQPKIVILETNAIYRRISFKHSVMNKAERTLPIFRYHNRWKSLSLRDFNFTVDATHKERDKGYWYRTNFKKASTTEYMKPSGKTAKISSKNGRYVEQISDFCREHGAQLLFLSTPSTKNWNAQRHNGIEKFAKQLDIEYVDLNTLQTQVPIDWQADSRDGGDHLNYNGAQKVTTFLGQFLEEKGILPDHRQDKAYSSWDADYAAFIGAISDKCPLPSPTT